MVAKVKPEDLDIKIKFGGGLHTRASADEIDAREAADGQNFLLDLDNRELRPRPPFDLVATLPNGGSVLGGGSLLKADGTVSTLFQGAGVVYSWDGQTGFTQVGTCNANSKLRGHWRSHNWTLGDKLLLTDLTLNDTVKEWDGTTFQSTTFKNETGAGFGSFSAKYVDVSNERALFANVKDSSGTSLPHLMIGSAVDDYTQISVANKPSDALSNADPFYIATPDLKPINGLVGAFGTRILSTEKGSLFNLDGTSAKDFSFGEFFAGSGASGYESLTYIGNDVVYGRQGRIESVRDTNAFGNSEAIDLTREIADQIAGYGGWTTVFNGRLNRAYFLPENQSELWVFNTAFRTSRLLSANVLDQFVYQNDPKNASGKLSPWMRWKTNHSLSFEPTFIQEMLDPIDGLEYVFMGDSLGNIYRLEGSGDGDGGTTDVDVSWTSKVFSAPLDAEVFEVEGYIKYKKDVSATVTLTFLAAGMTAFDSSITVNIPGVTGVNYWGDPSKYWGGDNYWGAQFQDRLIRQKFKVPGQMSDFQVRVDVSGTNPFNINEIGLRLRAASQ